MQSSQGAPKNNSETQTKKLERVHARKLDGFDLSPESGSAGTQIGGASRGGVADIVLLAPKQGPGV